MRNAALPTAPVVGVPEGAVVCAMAAETSPTERSKDNAALRIMTR